ncbi:hypothetical protein E4U16_005212 [Claviceps sp. LM84 group G4]|nr:hypothetical protein E4U16_005212 [Claviceps sp. LM84 group G4]
MQQLATPARTSKRPGPPPATFATRDPLSRRRSRDNAVIQLIGVGYGVPGWTENMTRRSLSGTMIALPRNSGNYKARTDST